MDDALIQRLRHLAQVATDAGTALRPASHSAMVTSIAETAMRTFGAGGCSIATLDLTGEHLVFSASAGGSPDILGWRIPAHEGIAGYVYSTGQPLEVDDLADDPRFASDIATAVGYQPSVIIALPLVTEHDIIGVIEILDATVDRDMDLMQAFAHQAALALDQGRVFDQLGRALLEGAARAAEADTPLAHALRGLAQEDLERTPGIDLVLACLAELQDLGAEELQAAGELLEVHLRHARRRA